MKQNLVAEKSLQLAVRIVNLRNFLVKEKKEYTLSDQILRSGTSIGANIAESEYAQSDADFLAKLSISQKEAGETLYWLKLLYTTDYISEVQYDSLRDDTQEVLRLLSSIILKLKGKRLP